MMLFFRFSFISFSALVILFPQAFLMIFFFFFSDVILLLGSLPLSPLSGQEINSEQAHLVPVIVQDLTSAALHYS